MDYNHIEVLDEKTALTSVRDIYYLVELNSGESFKTFHECRIHVVDGILRVENNSGSTEYYTFSGVEIPGF